MVGAIPYESMSWKAQEWHALTYSTSEATVSVFELSKLIFWGHNWFDGFLNKIIKCKIDEAGCGGYNSWRYGSTYFVKCENVT